MTPPPQAKTRPRKRQAAPTLPSALPVGTVAHALQILKPGRNCWRIEQARRAAVLVDSADYYRQLEMALKRARHSILILGWDFDGRIRLRPDRQPDDGQPLGPFLRSLVEAHPGLEIRILVWSYAVIHAPGDTKALLLGEAWQEHPRIYLHLDSKHPFYGCHHQKVVVIDDSMAFAGGIDLTIRRWDSQMHEAAHACRVSPDGTPYAPVHDLQMAVEGDAARALGDLARARWKVALGETLLAGEARQDRWPETLEPEFTQMPVAIARTAPGWGDSPPVAEQAELTADAIAAAERSIYVEAQYLSSTMVRAALTKRLSEREGPEIVMVVTPFSRGLFERTVLAANRDRMMRRLSRLPGAHRLRFYYPVVPGPEGDCEVLVHAKLMIIDDRLLRVGSGNLSNRSMGLDTECDLVVEATGEEQRRTIADIRSRLLGEHLGVAAEEVTATIAATGSLIAAIEALNGHARGLRRFEPGDGPIRSALGSFLVDPKRPWEPLWFLRRKGR